jgi:hypothetical protein
MHDSEISVSKFAALFVRGILECPYETGVADF